MQTAPISCNQIEIVKLVQSVILASRPLGNKNDAIVTDYCLTVHQQINK